MPVRVVLERGPKAKKSVAFAVDWPGWSRGAKTADGAVETLAAYRERYRPVAVRAGLGRAFDDAGPLDVVEDRVGTGNTDFWGISFSPSSLEQEPMDAAELERKLTLLQACWAFFDDVAARVSPQMRKGPRGGGRDRDTIIRHTIRNESEVFAKRVGLVVPEYGAVDPVPWLRTGPHTSRRCAPTSVASSSGRCGRGPWPSWSAIPPSTRWTMRGRCRTKTYPARRATRPSADNGPLTGLAASTTSRPGATHRRPAGLIGCALMPQAARLTRPAIGGLCQTLVPGVVGFAVIARVLALRLPTMVRRQVWPR
jgi:hypothetical protein